MQNSPKWQCRTQGQVLITALLQMLKQQRLKRGQKMCMIKWYLKKASIPCKKSWLGD